MKHLKLFENFNKKYYHATFSYFLPSIMKKGLISGGEKFRVSLAIRLALSKILTRRAGVDLELLILDEPGAFLDDNGRNSFVQMINGLKDSFSNILVITHLTELKAAFDNRLNIGD